MGRPICTAGNRNAWWDEFLPPPRGVLVEEVPLTTGVTEHHGGEPRVFTYTENDWDEESYQLFVERGDPRPCPECGRTGFYGPRAADPGLKYRACRFCGFWQLVGQEPTHLRATAHACSAWPSCARAPYVWWVQPDQRTYKCPYCDQQVVLESRNAFVKGAALETPATDANHPWHKVPQGRSYSYYLRFWENWPVTKGRVIL